MKVIFSYPPLDTSKGFPTLGQNRQFQYFSEPTFIYPVVPAIAATMLRDAGHQVIWNDCPAEGIGREGYFRLLEREKPDLIVFESKTPVIKEHWRLISEIKGPIAARRSPVIVLCGDHVTALPEESMGHCPVDYVLTGGDYDFLLRELGAVLSSAEPRSLPPGIWYRENGEIKNTGPFRIERDLDPAPFIDRELTKWKLYAYKNGNYRRTPGTYIMSGRDCWWGQCSFCSWTGLYPEFRVRSVENVLEEVGELVGKYPVREIMDDTGTFPRGDWLRNFCRGAIGRGFPRKVSFDCNFRFGAATEEDYRLMKKAGFRLLLFGLESGNQSTLDRLGKNLKIETIIDSCRMARRAGLYPHITVMFGYPWESYEQARNTLRLARTLLRKGYAYTMQATVVVPYPGTALYRECRDKGWLTTADWTDFDMKRPVMRVPYPEQEVLRLIREIYAVAFDPVFLVRKLLSLRSPADLRYFSRAGKKVWGHIRDFQ